MFLKMDMDAVSGMLPCDQRTPLPPRAPALPPKAHAIARIDWTIQGLPHKMATSPLEKELKASRELIALYKEGMASLDADITQLRAERDILEAQIKASNALVKSANGMETLLQNELEAAIRVQNDLKKKLTAAEATAKAFEKTNEETKNAKRKLHNALTIQKSLTTELNATREDLARSISSAKKELVAKDEEILALKEALRIAQRAVDREAQRAVEDPTYIKTEYNRLLAGYREIRQELEEKNKSVEALNSELQATKEALRIAQRAVDTVNTPTLQARLEASEKELKVVRAALRNAQKAPPPPADTTQWCLCDGTGTYVKRQVGDGWVQEVTTTCPAPKHYSSPSPWCFCNGTGTSYTKRCEVNLIDAINLDPNSVKCSVHTKTLDAYGIPTHHADGTELSRNQRKAHEAAHATQEPTKKPAPAPAQVLPRAHVAGDLLQEASTQAFKKKPLPDILTILQAYKKPTETYKKHVPTSAQVPEKPLTRAATGYDPYDVTFDRLGGDEDTGVSDDTVETILREGIHPSDPDVPLGTLLTNMFKSLHVKETSTSTDDVLPALLKALDVVGKKAFSEKPELAQEVLYSFLKGVVDNPKAEECNVQ